MRLYLLLALLAVCLRMSYSGNSCTTNSDCASGQTCSSGRCTCTTNADCTPTTEVCTTGSNFVCKCFEGYYDNSGTCTICPIGTFSYSGDIGLTTCYDCSSGTGSWAGTIANYGYVSTTIATGTVGNGVDVCIHVPTGQPSGQPSMQPTGQPSGQVSCREYSPC
jgi:hypothetical protein